MWDFILAFFMGGNLGMRLVEYVLIPNAEVKEVITIDEEPASRRKSNETYTEQSLGASLPSTSTVTPTSTWAASTGYM